jgi:effector-binding domain-containing protein
MLDEPEIVQTEARQAAVIHLRIPCAEIKDVMGPAFQEILGVLATQRIKPAGPFFSHHLRMEPGFFDFEAGVPVTKPVSPSGRVKPGALPAARVVRTVYHGPYEGLGEAWEEFDDWIDAEELEVGPDLWECYLAGPESGPDPSLWRTELNHPVIG